MSGFLARGRGAQKGVIECLIPSPVHAVLPPNVPVGWAAQQTMQPSMFSLLIGLPLPP